MGTLLSSGFTLNLIVDMSFEHIELCARCIMRHKVSMFEMVMEPIAAGLGSKKARKNIKKKQAEANRLKNQEMKSKLNPDQKDALLLGKLNMLGFGVTEKPKS